MRAKKDKFMPDRYTTSTVLTENDLLLTGHFVATSGEIYFTLPDPRNLTEDWEAKFTNASTGYIVVHTTQDLTDSSDSVAIAPGDSVDFVCTRVSDSAPYRHAWVAQGQHLPPQWAAFTPTLTWTTADPTISAYSYKYKIDDGLLHFDMDITMSDGKAASALTATLPFIPQDIDVMWPVAASVKIGTGNATNILGYIDATSGTAETRQTIAFRNFQTLTTATAARLRISGAIPLYGATSFTSTPAWTGGSPTVTSTTSVYKVVDGVCYGGIYGIMSDGKDATAVTYTVPVPHNDVDQMVACSGIQLVDATYSNPIPYLEAANATAANRLFSLGACSKLTNAKACTIAISFQYAVHNDLAYTPTETFTTATPATYTSSLRYSVSDGTCRFQYYGTSADGNAATGLTVTLPLVPRYNAGRRRALACNMLIDSTYSDAAAYIDHSQTAAADRALIRLEYHQTATDATTVTYHVAGEYEI